MNRLSSSALLYLFFFVALSSAFPGFATGAVVLFDQGHSQRFLVGKSGPLDLSGLAARVEQAGFDVKSVMTPLSAEVLSSVDALVLSGPFAPYSSKEIEAIAAFVEKGGRLAVMLHIGQPLAGLLERLGVDFSNAPVHEEENIIDNDSLNFRVTRLETHQLTAGLDAIAFYGVWALSATPEGRQAIATTSPVSWIDLDGNKKKSAADAVQPFAVAVAGELGQGRFVVFGDDALFQNRFLEGNGKLADNLAVWLGKQETGSR